MPISVDPSSRPIIPDAPSLPTRAHKAEPDTAKPIAAELERVSADLDWDDAASVEHERLARLRRWQQER